MQTKNFLKYIYAYIKHNCFKEVYFCKINTNIEVNEICFCIYETLTKALSIFLKKTYIKKFKTFLKNISAYKNHKGSREVYFYAPTKYTELYEAN